MVLITKIWSSFLFCVLYLSQHHTYKGYLTQIRAIWYNRGILGGKYYNWRCLIINRNKPLKKIFTGFDIFIFWLEYVLLNKTFYCFDGYIYIYTAQTQELKKNCQRVQCWKTCILCVFIRNKINHRRNNRKIFNIIWSVQNINPCRLGLWLCNVYTVVYRVW